MARPNKFTGQRVLETSGLPPRSGDTSPELQQLFAQKFGFIRHPNLENLVLPERFCDISLGNPDLPVYKYKDTVIKTVNESPISIFVAETGAGKSTQIPQFLLEEGYEVIMTQPRRLAAEMVARRIQDEVTDKLGTPAFELVGYQTAEKNTVTDVTRISVVTDGLQLVRELDTQTQERENHSGIRVIIIDEVHERNKNIDVLMAWVKKRIAEGDTSIRVVYMTASINAERLSRYHADTGFIPPIIDIPGAPHSIERLEEPESNIVEQAVKYAKQGKNVLIFVPGVSEIEDTLSAIRKKLSGDKGKYSYLSLHGKMSQQEQAAVEMEFNGVKIVCATNIAETSITIPDVDVIVDSGLERRVEIDRDGIESLRVLPISRASCIQRSGRCGRTHEGTYVLTRLNERVSHVPLISRAEYGIPEILRSNTDKTVLSIAGTGLDIRQLSLLDPIPSETIDRSYAALKILGALDVDNKITQRGYRMNKMPLRPSLARMAVYTEERNFSDEMKSYVAAMVSTIESGGLPDYTKNSGKAWKKLTNETSSDLLAQLDMYLQTINIEESRELAEHDLNIRSVVRSRELHQKLLRRMRVQPVELTPIFNEEVRQKIRDSIVSGNVDFVYEPNGKEYIRTSHRIGKAAVLRDLSDRSVVKGSADFVVGTPYMIAPPAGKDLPERHIIQDVTKTTARQLGEVAAELCSWKNDDSGFVWRGDNPFTRQINVFRETIPTGEFREEPAKWSKGLAAEIVQKARSHPGKTLKKINAMKKISEELFHRSGTTARITDEEVKVILDEVAGINKGRSKIMNVNMLDLELTNYIDSLKKKLPSEEEQRNIVEASPDFVEFEGMQLSIAYRNGKPYIAKITDEIKKTLARAHWDDFQLDDGREIMIPHRVGKYSRQYTIDEFRGVYPLRGL